MKSLNSHFRLILVAVLLACCGKRIEESSVSREGNSIVDKIKLKDMNGSPIDLNQYKGKAIFINFWATWCGPCVKEMPAIERVKNILKDKPIEFMFATNESVERIQSFIKNRKLNLNYVQAENMEELGIQVLPVTYIISPKGELVFSEPGYREWDDEKNIELLTKITSNQ